MICGRFVTREVTRYQNPDPLDRIAFGKLQAIQFFI